MKAIIFISLLIVNQAIAEPYTNKVIQVEKVIEISKVIIGKKGAVGESGTWIGFNVLAGIDATGDNIQDIVIQSEKDAVFISGASITQELFWIENELNGTNAFIIGAGTYQNVAKMYLSRDINGDGIGDILNKNTYVTNEYGLLNGMLLITIGTNVHESKITITDSLLPTGFIIKPSTNEYSRASEIMSDCDINDDGENDIITGGHVGIDGKYGLYVRYGGKQTTDVWSVENIDGTNGIFFTEFSGECATGDYDGDEKEDLMAGFGSSLILLHAKPRFTKTLSATNLPPEDGVTIKNASLRKNGGFGDINGDGIDDIIMYGGVVMFGRTNWGTNPDAATMGLGEIMTPTGATYGGLTAVIGDLNGDGYDDWGMRTSILLPTPPDSTNLTLIMYGRPMYPETMNLWLPNGTNGFAIAGENIGEPGHPYIIDPIYSETRGGDWDNDGYEEAIFGIPTYYHALSPNNEGIVTITPGGPSPAWSPYIFTPELIMEGRSNMFASTVLTNIVTGRKGKRHMVLSDGPEPIEQEWLGTWFTTRVIRTTIDDTRTVNYWTTNILGRSKPATTLVINAVPEPGMIMAAMMIAIGIVTGRKSI